MFDLAPSTGLRVLVACECSGTVRDAFRALGHEAVSCDTKADETGSNHHIQADIRDVLDNPLIYGNWDLLVVAHPPCTRLCNSGARWLTKAPGSPVADCTPEQREAWPTLSDDQKLAIVWDHLRDGADLFSRMWNADVPCIAVENLVMHKHAKALIENFEPHAQSVQPWQFGEDENGEDNEKKRTCFWIRGLPKLEATGTLDGTTARSSVHHAKPGVARATERSRFFPGMSAAIADQWGRAAMAVKQELEAQPA